MTEVLAQRTDDWFAARQGRLTASRVPAILGHSKYRTADDVLREMVRESYGYEREFQGNAATQWGNEQEPRARADYEADTGHWVDEVGLVVHPEHDWLAASPDGLIEDDGYLEIKCPYSGDMTAKPEWLVQLQFGLHVTGRSWGHLYIWTPERARIETVVVDSEFLERNRVSLEAFLARYQEAVESEEVARPHLEPLVVERDDDRWRDAASQFAEAKRVKEAAESDMKAAKERLAEMAGDKTTEGWGVRITPVTKSGGYDYRQAAQDAGADLEQYRKPGRTEYRVTVQEPTSSEEAA